MNKEIFMIGEQRSGSNLLRVMLNCDKDLIAPHPPHILQRLYPLLSNYGDLQNEDNFIQLIRDVLELIKRNPVSWEKPVPTVSDIRNRCREKSLVAVFGAVMNQYAETHHAKSWLCKSMQTVRWGDELERYFRNPFYIHLVRDPRDVVLSFTKAVVGEKHPFSIAKRWADIQMKCLLHKKRIPSERYASISYENLIDNPEAILRNLTSKIGMEYSPSMMEFHRKKEADNAAKKSKLWSNLSKPLMSNNSNKFKKELSEESIWIVEAVAGHIMDELGYERMLTKKGETPIISNTDILKYTLDNDRLKKEMAQKVEPEDKARRKYQLSVLEEIKNRKTVVQYENMESGQGQ